MKDLNTQLSNIEFIMMNNDNPTGIQELDISEEERLALLTHIAKIRRIEETNNLAYCVSRVKLSELFEYSDKEKDSDYGDDKRPQEMALLKEITDLKRTVYTKGHDHALETFTQAGASIIDQMGDLENDPKIKHHIDKLKNIFSL